MRGPHSTPFTVTPAIPKWKCTLYDSQIQSLVKLPLQIPSNFPIIFSNSSPLTSMAEEFEESEVIFQERDEVIHLRCNFPESKRRKVLESDTAPVRINIPDNVSRNAWFRSDFDGGDGEMVPPHVIIGRRVAEKIMAVSLCTGYGRTLKGRDLSEFRNSILRLTGFLET